MDKLKMEKAVRSAGFRWMVGMLAYIPVEDDNSYEPIRLTAPVVEVWNRKGITDCLPDIEDPATIGCLCALAEIMPDVDELLDALEDSGNKIA